MVTCPRFDKVIFLKSFRTSVILVLCTSVFDQFSLLTGVNENRLDLLSKQDRDRLEDHIAKLERSTMDKYRVFVMTVGTCMDYRLEAWNKPKPKTTTVIIDEAGQLSQPRALYAFLFHQVRTVLFGDHQQLKEQCQSYSAKLAGLGNSVMFWLLFGYSTEL